MTTYLGEKAVGVGTVKATMNVGKVITDKKTVLGDGFTEPLAVNTLLFATTEGIAASADALRTEMNNKIAVVNASIDGVSEAVAKTRNDYEVADQEIRDDLNEGLSELQTQITAQAAEIATKQDKLIAGDNIIISGNVITATGGDAGFDVTIVQELPAEGQKGIIYLLAKDSEAPDIYDEYIWVTATQTFEFIGTTQVDLSGYATKEDLNTVLPDQTGNTGKFLITDGSTASWSNKPLVNRTTKSGTQSMIVGDSTMDNSYNRNVLFGFNTRSFSAGNVRFGFGGLDYGSYNFSFGHYHETQSGVYGTINLGWACKPTESQTLNVCFAGGDGNTGKTETYTLLSADGTIPLERLTKVTDQIGDISTALTAILGE